jgi:hypothetical protein
MTEEHRRQLQGLGRHIEMTEESAVDAGSSVMSAGPTWIGREVDGYPAVREHLGSWLIRAGTRLGGASVSTS